MSNRITEANLIGLCEALNRITNSPQTTYMKDHSGKNVSQIGNFHLSFAYGGVALHRICNHSGGVEDVLRSGHIKKRDLWNRMRALLDGITITKDVSHE